MSEKKKESKVKLIKWDNVCEHNVKFYGLTDIFYIDNSCNMLIYMNHLSFTPNYQALQ